LFDHYHFNVGDLRSVPKGKWSQFKRGRKVEGKRLRNRGKGSEVLQWQGSRSKTLGERGSLRCCLSKASCSFLLPQVYLGKTASITDKSRHESEVRESVAKARPYHQTLEAGRP